MTTQAFSLPGTVESVVATRKNGLLIAVAATLWIDEDDTVLDMTYGNGMFWTHYRPQQLIRHDIRSDGVDFRALPEVDSSIDVVVFDPPYIAQGGRETSTMPEFLDTYGLTESPRSVAESQELIAVGIAEAARVLVGGGRLFVKCMDYINGGRFVKGRHHVVTAAESCGLVQVDEFVHHSGSGPQPDHQRQLHSRRTHSFLCVFQRPRRVVVNESVP